MDPAALDGGAPPPPVPKANADEFIHIFVNQALKLTEFLEHMVKVSVKVKMSGKVRSQASRGQGSVVSQSRSLVSLDHSCSPVTLTFVVTSPW